MSESAPQPDPFGVLIQWSVKSKGLLTEVSQPLTAAQLYSAPSGQSASSVDSMFAQDDTAWGTADAEGATVGLNLSHERLLLDAVSSSSGLEEVLSDIADDVVGALDGWQEQTVEDALLGGSIDPDDDPA